MALIDLLQFRVHSVRCLRPTDHSILEPDPDAIDLAVITIDESGETDPSRTFFTGSFRAGTRRDFDPPLVAYQFDLNEVAVWPRTYFGILVLAERDDWGRLDDWVGHAVRGLSEAAASALSRLTSEEVGRALDSEELGGAAGGVVAAVVRAFLGAVFGALDTDVLTPAETSLQLVAPETLVPMSDTGARAQRVTGHGGEYLVDFSWARRVLAGDEDPDPLVRELEVIIGTGGDDLRRGSSATLRFVFESSDGTALGEERFPFNHDRLDLWPPNSWQLAGASTSTRRFTMITPRPLSTFKRIFVNFIGGRRPGFEGFFDTDDNWDMTSLVVRYHSDRASGLLYSAAGSPLRRFGGGGGEYVARVRTSPGADVRISLQAHNGQFVVAEGGGGGPVLANRPRVREWETFTLIYLGDGRVALRAHGGQFVAAEGGGGRELVANRDRIDRWETFDLLPQDDGSVAFRAHNGQYFVAEGGGGREVAANRDRIGSWERFRLSFV